MSRVLMVQLSLALCLLVPIAIEASVENDNTSTKPHIVIIVADDMGWNDVSFHGSDQIATPNIDALAYNGVILNKHYAQQICTPSRAALMTGKYPIHMGMQDNAIFPSEPRGLPLKEKLLSQYLKEAGYATHIVGKWHLGYFKEKYTPLSRGFDTHFGYWNGLQDYYNHKTAEPYTPNEGLDMRRNMSIAWDTIGKYSTDLFTDEAVHIINNHNALEKPLFLYLAQIAPHSGNECDLLQAPPKEIEKFSYISDKKRRIYAAMVSILDKSVGKVIEALKNKNMLENCIIIFISDNGAPTNGFLSNHGSNYPLRDIKDTLWEGAVRTAAAIWSPLIKNNKRVLKKLMHITDWLPTLLFAADINSNITGPIDGFNMWPTIAFDNPSPREEVLININDKKHEEAIIWGKYKYVSGQNTGCPKWVGDSGRNPSEKRPPYSPETVLQSKVGIAIAQVPNNNYSTLTSQEIVKLRKQAEVRCNNTKAQKFKPHTSLECLWSKVHNQPYLFDLENDPCETTNIIKQEPLVAKKLKETLLKYRKNMVPPNNKFIDWKASPLWWNNTWVCWEDSKENPLSKNISAAISVFITFSYIMFSKVKCLFKNGISL